jgi:hypothetical protein
MYLIKLISSPTYFFLLSYKLGPSYCILDLGQNWMSCISGRREQLAYFRTTIMFSSGRPDRQTRIPHSHPCPFRLIWLLLRCSASPSKKTGCRFRISVLLLVLSSTSLSSLLLLLSLLRLGSAPPPPPALAIPPSLPMTKEKEH